MLRYTYVSTVHKLYTECSIDADLPAHYDPISFNDLICLLLIMSLVVRSYLYSELFAFHCQQCYVSDQRYGEHNYITRYPSEDGSSCVVLCLLLSLSFFVKKKYINNGSSFLSSWNKCAICLLDAI